MKVGDTIVTSGLGGGYFRGLIVGTVVRVEDGNGQAVRQIVVAPNDSVSGLEEVMIVTSVSSKKNAADAKPAEDNADAKKAETESASAASEDEEGEILEDDSSADEEYDEGIEGEEEYEEEG